MNAFFQYPPAATFGRALPKTKIYEHARISTKLKQLLVDQVDKIVWQYKLATETTNLPATKAVPEIQIFSVTLKSGEIARYYGLYADFGQTAQVTYDHPTGGHTNVRSVTMPNVGGSAGLSWRVQDFKVSMGYRADFFFGALDGGIDVAKKENVGFYGPFVSVSVGIGR